MTSVQADRNVVREALRSVGYGDAHVHFGWPVGDHEVLRRWSTDSDPSRLPTGRSRTLDVIAFHDDREHDWNTTALVAELERPELVSNGDDGRARAQELFRLTAAPCVLFRRNGAADLWLECWAEPKLVGDIQFQVAPLEKAFRKHRRDLEREALATLRGGQRYLFDSVYSAQRDELVQFLHRGISKATWLEKRLSEKKFQKEFQKERESLSRVAIGLLAARILEDKGFFSRTGEPPDSQTTNGREILQRADAKADLFFTHLVRQDLPQLEQGLGVEVVDQMLACIMAHLTGPASFTMVTPETLGHLYERALAAERRRASAGYLDLNSSHYTPLSLARHILSRIPIEELPPSQRYIADIACGSGSFLQAGTERLGEIFDGRERDAEESPLAHVRKHVIGNDIDEIALLVARLGYLLNHWVTAHERDNVPEPDRLWAKDARALEPAHFADCSPSIIVGNPPFGSIPGQQMANLFLLKCLDLLRPGGFLGMVMPGGFLKMSRQKCPEVRRKLLESCELLEIWEQPAHTVGLVAEQDTSVVIARKHDGARRARTPVLFKATYSRSRSTVTSLQNKLRSTWTFAATGLPGAPGRSWAQDRKSRIIASPIEAVWRKLDPRRQLLALCEEGTGINAPAKLATFSPDKAPGFEACLKTQSRLRPFHLEERHWRDESDPEHNFVDPATALRPNEPSWPLYRAAKVIVRSDTNRNSRSQIAAAFDDTGVFPGHHFRCLGLRAASATTERWAQRLLANHAPTDLLLWITAVLNSPVSHAWVATCSPPRGLLRLVLEELPLPRRFDREIPRLVAQTRAVERAQADELPLWAVQKRKGEADREDTFSELVAEINRRVTESYGLCDEDVSALQSYLEGMTNPWVESDERAHLPRIDTSYRRITGTVVSVDVADQTATLDIPRYSRKAGGPVVVPIPRHLPGWALREGAEFTCLAPADRRDPRDIQDPWLLREFEPVPYSYLKRAELELLVGRGAPGKET